MSSQDSSRRHVRNYLLDIKLQLRHTLLMVIVSTLLSTVLGVIWYRQVRITSRMLEAKQLVYLSDADVQQVRENLSSQDKSSLIIVISYGFTFVLMVAGYGIMLTHKIAGPLFKISRYMHNIRDDHLGELDDIRRGDHLQVFYEQFKEMHAELCNRTKLDIERLNRVVEALTSRKDVLDEELSTALSELQSLVAQKQKSLMPPELL